MGCQPERLNLLGSYENALNSKPQKLNLEEMTLQEQENERQRRKANAKYPLASYKKYASDQKKLNTQRDSHNLYRDFKEL